MILALLRIIKLAFFLACIWTLLACSLFSFKSTTHYRDSEGHFSSALLDNIENQKTSLQWLKSQFGEPLFIDSGPEDAAICTWRFYKQTLKNNSVFLLWNQKKLSEEPLYLHTVVQNGTVLKSWRDQFEKVDTQRIFSDIATLNDIGVVEKARAQAHPSSAKSTMEGSPREVSPLMDSIRDEEKTDSSMGNTEKASMNTQEEKFPMESETAMDQIEGEQALSDKTTDQIPERSPIKPSSVENPTTTPSIAPSEVSSTDKDVLYGI